MASHLVQIYRAIKSTCLDPNQPGLGVNYIDFADYYRVGPELGDRIARLGPQEGLNAIIVAPLAPDEEPADAAKRLRKVTQPFDVFFIYKRENEGVQTDLVDIIEKYADPLHDVLCAEQARRLGNLKLTNAGGDRVGHVVGFDVFVPNTDVPDNDALYPLGLACFTIRVEVHYITARDRETILTQ